MEDNSSQKFEQSAPAAVSFPSTASGGSKKKSGRAKGIIAILGVVIIVAVGGYLLLRFTNSPVEEDNSPSATTQGLSTFATPEPTPTPEAKAKADVVIEVLNGTGTAGDAGLAKDELVDLGYEQITADNADSQDESITTITYDRGLDEANMDAITKAIEDVFEEVKVKKASLSGGVDVRIVTGPRAGATPTPEATSEPTASPTSTPTASPTASPTPTGAEQ
jgi:hypothetical protein